MPMVITLVQNDQEYDMSTGLVHTVVGRAGNIADVTQAHALLHGEEKVVLGDAGSVD